MSTVLENHYDPNYEPSATEVEEYGKWLGMDLPQEKHLLWIAKEGLKAPMPESWKACKSDKGELYYFNFKSGASMWDHPMDEHFKGKLKAERDRIANGQPSSKSSPTHATAATVVASAGQSSSAKAASLTATATATAAASNGASKPKRSSSASSDKADKKKEKKDKKDKKEKKSSVSSVTEQAQPLVSSVLTGQRSANGAVKGAVPSSVTASEKVPVDAELEASNSSLPVMKEDGEDLILPASRSGGPAAAAAALAQQSTSRSNTGSVAPMHTGILSAGKLGHLKSLKSGRDATGASSMPTSTHPATRGADDRDTARKETERTRSSSAGSRNGESAAGAPQQGLAPLKQRKTLSPVRTEVELPPAAQPASNPVSGTSTPRDGGAASQPGSARGSAFGQVLSNATAGASAASAASKNGNGTAAGALKRERRSSVSIVERALTPEPSASSSSSDSDDDVRLPPAAATSTALDRRSNNHLSNTAAASGDGDGDGGDMAAFAASTKQEFIAAKKQHDSTMKQLKHQQSEERKEAAESFRHELEHMRKQQQQTLKTAKDRSERQLELKKDEVQTRIEQEWAEIQVEVQKVEAQLEKEKASLEVKKSALVEATAAAESASAALLDVEAAKARTRENEAATLDSTTVTSRAQVDTLCANAAEFESQLTAAHASFAETLAMAEGQFAVAFAAELVEASVSVVKLELEKSIQNLTAADQEQRGRLESEIQQAAESHAVRIAAVREAHAAELKRAEADHASTMARATATHSTQLESLKAQLAAEEAEVRAKGKQSIEHLKEELAKQVEVETNAARLAVAAARNAAASPAANPPIAPIVVPAPKAPSLDAVALHHKNTVPTVEQLHQLAHGQVEAGPGAFASPQVLMPVGAPAVQMMLSPQSAMAATPAPQAVLPFNSPAAATHQLGKQSTNERQQHEHQQVQQMQGDAKKQQAVRGDSDQDDDEAIAMLEALTAASASDADAVLSNMTSPDRATAAASKLQPQPVGLNNAQQVIAEPAQSHMSTQSGVVMTQQPPQSQRLQKIAPPMPAPLQPEMLVPATTMPNPAAAIDPQASSGATLSPVLTGDDLRQAVLGVLQDFFGRASPPPPQAISGGEVVMAHVGQASSPFSPTAKQAAPTANQALVDDVDLGQEEKETHSFGVQAFGSPRSVAQQTSLQRSSTARRNTQPFSGHDAAPDSTTEQPQAQPQAQPQSSTKRHQALMPRDLAMSTSSAPASVDVKKRLSGEFAAVAPAFQQQQLLIESERSRIRSAAAFVEKQRTALVKQRAALKEARRKWKQDVHAAKAARVSGKSKQAQVLRSVHTLLDDQADGLVRDELVLQETMEWLIETEARVAKYEAQVADAKVEFERSWTVNGDHNDTHGEHDHSLNTTSLSFLRLDVPPPPMSLRGFFTGADQPGGTHVHGTQSSVKRETRSSSKTHTTAAHGHHRHPSVPLDPHADVHAAAAAAATAIAAPSTRTKTSRDGGVRSTKSHSAQSSHHGDLFVDPNAVMTAGGVLSAPASTRARPGGIALGALDPNAQSGRSKTSRSSKFALSLASSGVADAAPYASTRGRAAAESDALSGATRPRSRSASVGDKRRSSAVTSAVVKGHPAPVDVEARLGRVEGMLEKVTSLVAANVAPPQRPVSHSGQQDSRRASRTGSAKSSRRPSPEMPGGAFVDVPRVRFAADVQQPPYSTSAF